ncbi:hypothetical protein [Desulfosporosinus lacus]|uniref:Uncharacterized protein n=1 Tax=Desulfosporosinus lacus DSM 15449 TaxID=1121420 RepID=A0A1M6BBK4_9FIRM|nr:hypothetical protein [Desulfosporosinus lacus]SHI46066.1 hypothetical protein SAMN02746098_04136 [Desulfosporosinus lacus DSM 15449]
MTIPEKDFYHGAVLAAITEAERFTSINKGASPNKTIIPGLFT